MMKRKAMGLNVVVACLAVSILVGCEIGGTDGGSLGSPGEGGGFLWKPVSESNRKLVVLTPPQYTGKISGCFVADGGGSVVEQGAFGGVHNGGREHFRFTQPGAAYGNNVNVVADLKDGGSVYWVVPNGSQRYEQ